MRKVFSKSGDFRQEISRNSNSYSHLRVHSMVPDKHRTRGGQGEDRHEETVPILSPKGTKKIAQGKAASAATLGWHRKKKSDPEGVEQMRNWFVPFRDAKHYPNPTQGAVRSAHFTLGYYLASLSGTFKDVLRTSYTFCLQLPGIGLDAGGIG